MAIDIAAIGDGLAIDDGLDGNVTFEGATNALLLLVVVTDDAVGCRCGFRCCFGFRFRDFDPDVGVGLQPCGREFELRKHLSQGQRSDPSTITSTLLYSSSISFSCE